MSSEQSNRQVPLNEATSKMTIVEDMPVMCSVAMMGSPAPSLMSLQRQPLMKSPAPISPSWDEQPTLSKASSPITWNLDNISIEFIPEYYQLERTHIAVDAAAPIVARRIADCLRKESITANFHNSEASVDAETCDQVQFCVRLWRGHRDDHVIVEVQRIRGCCFLYCQAAKSIMRAAKGLMRPVSSLPPLPRSLPKCLPPITVEEEQRNMQEGLDIASSMLQTPNRMDVHALALESLVKLSAACKCRAYAARTIMSSSILETLICLIECYRFSRSSESERLVMSEIEEQHYSVLHSHALSVLANCLDSLSTTGELTSIFQTNAGEELQSSRLLNSLVTEVSHCKQRPHEASVAIRCLHVLVKHFSPSAKQILSNLGTARVVALAQEEGLCRHEQLYQEALKLVELGQF